MILIVVLVALLSVWQPTVHGEPAEAMLLTEPASLELLEEGRDQIMAGRLGPAEKTLYRLAAQPDGAPAAYHHLATVSILRVLLFDRETDYDGFFARSDSLRDLLRRVPRSRGRTYLSAETDFHRALAWAKTENYVRSAMAAVSAYRGLAGLVDDDPTFYEAYKSLGIVHATLGTLPRRYRRFLSVFGFETDMEVGLDQLGAAARQSRFGREESLLFMAILDSFEMPSRLDAVETLSALSEQHGRSPLFTLVEVDALMRSRRVARADSLLELITSKEQEDSDLIRLEYLEFYRAEVLFKREQWNESAEVYARYRTMHKGPALKAVAALREGLALEMAGRRQDAEAVFQRMAAQREFDSDEASVRSARRLLETPMAEEERVLLRARCAHDRSDYERAESLLVALEARVPTDQTQLLAEISYRRGRVLDETGRDDEAMQQYARAISNPGDPSAKWAPYGLYYLARIHEEAGRQDEAIGTYRAVVDYEPGYDYKGTNDQRARFALRRLGG